jgi:mevalonate kinase
LGIEQPPAVTLLIRSSIPVASGMGSGAAVSVALIRALAAFLGSPLPDEQVNRLAYRVEQRLHGTPSGIDNTVITYAQPIFFQRDSGFERLSVGAPLQFVVADTGAASSTREAVAAVRADWQRDPQRSEAMFDEIGGIAWQARAAIEHGDERLLGSLMDTNQHCLQALGVSSPTLDRLIDAARAAGALGAKLSGGGRGGILVALAAPEDLARVEAGLKGAGAKRVIATRLEPTPQESG